MSSGPFYDQHDLLLSLENVNPLLKVEEEFHE